MNRTSIRDMTDEPIGFGEAAARKGIIGLPRPEKRSVVARIDGEDFEDVDEGVAVAGSRKKMPRCDAGVGCCEGEESQKRR